MEPPTEGRPLTEQLELRILAAASSSLAALGFLTSAVFPFLLGFSALDFLVNIGASLGLLAAALLARGGRAEASSNLLLGFLVAAIWAITLRHGDGPLHHLFILSNLLPVMLAFSLRRFLLGMLVAAAATVFAVAHVLEGGHPLYEGLTVAVLLVGGVAVAGIGPYLRAHEGERAAAAEREALRFHELARLRADFLNMAAHDLRTPLTPLKLQMATIRLRWDSLPEHHRASFGLLERNLQRFEALVEDMLEAARMHAGRLRLRRTATPLAPLVHDAAATFAGVAGEAGITLAVGDVPSVRIDADGPKCMQVLVNLVSNAVRYTPRGGRVRIDVTASQHEAEVIVADTGLGMTAEQVGMLFQPFTRLHPEVRGGTGLGLYISKGIVEQHGGRIWAESGGPGKGSTFHVSWPLAPAGMPDDAGSAPAPPATAPPAA